MTLIIAIDGPAASGKGTIAKKVAKALVFDYLNTGLLYRAVAFFAIQHDIASDDVGSLVQIAQDLNLEMINDLELYTSQIATLSSIISSILQLREALLDIQRKFAFDKKGVVVEGRDIGTVIFPRAQLKFYITADIEERARRRFKQLQKKQESIIYNEVLRDMHARDSRDSNRAEAPLKQADDSVVVDTTNLEVNESVDMILRKVRELF